MKRHLQVFISFALMAFFAVGVKAQSEFVWDFSKKTYSEASEDKVVWESDYATLQVDKADAKTPANNYLGGDANNRTSSRFYNGSKVTITPADGYEISSVVFECTTNAYATALQSSTWENAAAGVADAIVTVTPTDGSKAFSASIGATTGSKTVTVHYNEAGGIKAPTISPVTGTYADAQTVTITAEEGYTIYYTLNDTDYEIYTAPFTVDQTTEVSAYASDGQGNISPTTVSTITIGAIIYQAEFKNNPGDFTTNNVNMSDPLNYVWNNNSYGWVASAYVGASYEAESWLISPAFSIAAGSEAVLTFMHALNKGTKDACGLYVSEDKSNWTEVDVPNWPAGTDWNFISSGEIDLSSYAGKTIYLGFKYSSTTSNAPSWEIQELQLKGKGSAAEVEAPVYTTIAAAKSAATADKITSVLKLKGVTVVYVNGSSTYITDGTDGFLLYGSSIGLKAGENVDVTVEGQLYLYNGLPELSVSKVEESTVNSEGNAVEPLVVEIADLVADPIKYSSLLVKVEGVGIEEEEWTERNVTLIQDGEECLMRDNWNIATDMTFKTDKDYDITGFLAIHNTDVQIYPRTADDIELQTSQAKPASEWKSGEEVVTSLQFSAIDDVVDALFTTDSDGAVTYKSSDESVATVDETGKITLVGSGKCTITAETAETDAFQASTASLDIKVLILQGDGTKENPYTIADVNLLYDENTTSDPVWITGYIVGCVNGSLSKPAWSAEDSENIVKTNFIISDNPDTESVDECIPMELVKGEIRDNNNLVDHPENFGQQIKAYGSITKYFSVCGFKNVTEIIIGEEQQEETKKGDVNEDDKVDISDIVAVINQIAGTATYKNADVNGDEKVDISDIVAIINIIAGQ